ncbi:hypothetical protein LNQ03_31460 [Klebsiella pneumoniae subsp. pneumoniae]|nr:hypothetical protein [Klebsiella pneumoniae subsp. pneumoniae]
MIDDSHYRPAFDEGVRQQRAGNSRYYRQSAAGQFRQHARGAGAEWSAAGAGDEGSFSPHGWRPIPIPYIQSLDEQFSAELAGLGNDIWLNAALFQRVNSVYEQRDALALDSESYRLLTLTWQRFVHAGATLAPSSRRRCAH